MDIKPDYGNVASVVFSSPQVAQVGINEDKAVEEYGDVDIFTSTFSWVIVGFVCTTFHCLEGKGTLPSLKHCLNPVCVLASPMPLVPSV